MMKIELLELRLLVTLCFFTAGVLSQTCTNVDVSQGDQDTIVGLHNDLRHQVTNQPSTPGANSQNVLVDKNQIPLVPASNMEDLKWNNALAEAAEELTSKCKYEHNTPEVSGFGEVNQNLFKEDSTDKKTECDYAGAFASWKKEIESYDGQEQRRPFVYKQETSHFTQLIWAQTTDVGCSCSLNGESGNTKFPFRQFIACNYGPGGNLELGGPPNPDLEISIYDTTTDSKPSLEIKDLFPPA